MSKQLFGKIDNYKGQKVYIGASTDTADVIVDNINNTIAVNVKSLKAPSQDGDYILHCQVIQGVPNYYWVN